MIKAIFCLLVILYFVQSSHGEDQGELQDQNQVENTKDLLNRDAREAGPKKKEKSGKKSSKRQNRKKGGKRGKNNLKNQRKKNEKKNNIRRPGRKSSKRHRKGGKPGRKNSKSQKNPGKPGRNSSKRQKKGGKPGKNSLKRQRKKKEGKSEKKNSKIQKKKKLRKPGTKHSKNPKRKKVGKPGKNSSKRQRKKKARKSGKKSLKSQRQGTQENVDTNCKGDVANVTGGSYKVCLQKPSAFTCQIYWYSRAGSLARTESNRAKGTKRFIKKIENAINKKDTRYTEIIRALNMSTNDGTTCKGTTPPSSNVTEIYNGLINCSKTIPQHCQTSDVTGYKELMGELDNGTCSPMLEKYSTDYKYCLFALSGGANSKVCKCFLNDASLANDVVPSYPFTKSVETQYADIYEYRIATLDTFRCLPSPFTSVWGSAKKQWRKVCNDAGVTGSWGYCNAKLREAIQYVECGGANGCRTAGCTTPGETNTTTAASTTATVATTGSVTTAPSGRRYNLQNRLKRFLET